MAKANVMRSGRRVLGVLERGSRVGRTDEARYLFYREHWIDRWERFMGERRRAIRAAARRYYRTHPPYSLVGR